MAQVNDNILGNLSGRLGNIVFRKMNGKSFASIRPKKYKPAKSEEAVKTKNKFATVVKFASYINSIPEIKTIWKSSALNGKRGYNTIITINQSLLSKDLLKDKETLINIDNIIVPKGMDINLSHFNNEYDSISISYSLNELSDQALNINLIKSFFIFCFQLPVDPVSPSLKFSHSTYEVAGNNPDGEYEFSLNFSQEIRDLMDQYKSSILFYTSVFINSKGNIINWITSTAKSIELMNS